MDNILCLRCGNELVSAWLNTGAGTLLAESNKKKIFGETSTITVYVCKSCGHIELIADKTDIFK